MGDRTPVNVDNRPDGIASQTVTNGKAGQVGEKSQDSQLDDVAICQKQSEQNAAEPAWQGVPL